jgi:pyrimidine operon attenuation protein/uracil phosphoribosyltransferase
MMEKKYILDERAVVMKIRRMAFEILENNPADRHITLAGIQVNGSVLARQLADVLKEISDKHVDLIDIQFDKKHPSEIRLNPSEDFNNRVIIIIDDVTNSGKTLLYALKPFLGYYPKKIQTLVLVERSHKTYPIHPDYVGISLATTLQEHIVVEAGDGKVTGAYLA